MTTMDMIFSLLLLAGIFGWLLKRLRRFKATETSEITKPVTPNIPVLKQIIYAWWLVTGLWLERIDTVKSAESPFQHRLSILVHRFALLLIFGIFATVPYELISHL